MPVIRICAPPFPEEVEGHPSSVCCRATAQHSSGKVHPCTTSPRRRWRVAGSSPLQGPKSWREWSENGHQIWQLFMLMAKQAELSPRLVDLRPFPCSSAWETCQLRPPCSFCAPGNTETLTIPPVILPHFTTELSGSHGSIVYGS